MTHSARRMLTWAAAAVFAAGWMPEIGQAAVYKCRDAAGGITYSQTPCPTKDETVRVTGSRGSSKPVDCWYASKLALDTAREMQGGVDSSQVFDHYGGLNALSRGAISLINYVYSHRANDAVSAQRIAGLATARCQARALGDVSCEALPLAFTEKFGGCGAARPEQPQPAAEAAQFSPRPRQVVSNGAPPAVQQQAEERRQKCRAKYQAQLDRIDSEMRAGYTSREGERYRERQRALRKRLNDC